MARPSGRRTSQFKLKPPQPNPQIPSLDNDFRGGLKTEFTGLNFPENSCTAANNCRFTRVGNVTRRGGLDVVGVNQTINTTNVATSSFTWENAGGSGNIVIQVEQVGTTLYFFQVTNATPTSGISGTLLTTVAITPFVVGPNPSQLECQYAVGNGYLFVFNPACDPFYCTFDGVTTVTASVITIQIRDVITGIFEPGVPDSLRPISLSNEHLYNLYNQGWANNPAWSTSSSTSIAIGNGIVNATVGTGLSIFGGDPFLANGHYSTGSATWSMSGTVNSYAAGTGAISFTVSSFSPTPGSSGGTWTISKASQGNISAFQVAAGAYPSNGDIWYTFKNSSGLFSPSTTLGSVALSSGPAPKGYFILNAFNQDRGSISSVPGLTPVTTTVRPRTGAFFQGRVWYTGVDASQPPMGDEPFFTWSETIYFSQVIQTTSQFGRCYQSNDPTSETLPEILPTDGGTILIPGCGSIFKLFPVVNGLLVFAANGIWFITGNTGLGFTATDYSITKVTGEHALSSTSFVNVAGYPMFWNADGIYFIAPGQTLTSGQRGLEVKNLTLESIKTFYQAIPLASKAYARGSYNHLTGEVQWCYRSTLENGIGNRYTRDSVLTFLTYTGSFWNWTIGTSGVTDVIYLELPNNFNITPAFYYPCFSGNAYNFAQEFSNTFTDFTVFRGQSVNYTSTFTTAYRLKGQAIRESQIDYLYLFSEQPTTQYLIQGIWDYAATNLSNRFSSQQVVNNNKLQYNKTFNKIRIRGQGYVLQFKVTSSGNLPFNISGWSVLDTIGRR